MKVKKCLFPALAITFLCANGYGQGQLADNSLGSKQPQVPASVYKSILDSALKKDTVNDPGFVSDPKQGFKDLFVSSATSMNTTQLNPRAISFVQDYIQKQGTKLEKMKTWGKPYFDMMHKILEMHGVPGEMKYLAVIESHLKSTAVSWAGAVGPWQFMPATGRENGLRVDYFADERTDYYKSTHAAAHYLTVLFNRYRDWLLVIAAYNGGPGNVDAAIRKSGSRDFWSLQNYLPAESRTHVKKFIATHYIMEGEGGITTLTKDEAMNFKLNAVKDKSEEAPEEQAATGSLQTQFISGRYNSASIAQYVGLDIKLFNKYNPNFDNQIIDAGSYELHLPADKMELFQKNRVKILYESMQVMLKAINE